MWILATIIHVANLTVAVVHHNPTAALGWGCAALTSIVLIVQEYNN